MHISRQTHLGLVLEIQYSNYFQISDCSLAMKLPGQHQLSKKSLPVSSPTVHLAPAPIKQYNTLVSSALPKESASSLAQVHTTKQLARNIFWTTPNIKPVIPLATMGAKEETLSNGIKIYGSNVERKTYIKSVAEFFSLWEDDGFIRVLPEE